VPAAQGVSVVCVAFVVPALKARLQIQQANTGERRGRRKTDHQQPSHFASHLKPPEDLSLV
jgi:hypothetical protein